MKNFNPWPVGLIAFFVVFLSCIVGIIVFSLNQRTDLVSDSYYEDELVYQQKLDSAARTKALGDAVHVKYDPTAQQLKVQLPAAHNTPELAGTVTLYRPSDASLDRASALELDSNAAQSISLGDLPRGLWKVNVEWKHNDLGFNLEDSFHAN